MKNGKKEAQANEVGCHNSQSQRPPTRNPRVSEKERPERSIWTSVLSTLSSSQSTPQSSVIHMAFIPERSLPIPLQP
eukprot:3299303-Amphidinium_carterae.1